MYFSFIRPVPEYSDVIWTNLSQHQKDQMEELQNEAARILSGCCKLVSISDLNIESGWESLNDRRCQHKFKMVKELAPAYLNVLVSVLTQLGRSSSYSLRDLHN